MIIMDKKRITEALLAIFVAAIFISSYVSLTNYNTPQNATTTVPATIFAQGISNAVITGYGGDLYLNITCANHSAAAETVNTLTPYLTKLENNNSILNYFNPGWNISIAPENMSTYEIYASSLARLGRNYSGCVTGYATAFARLPQSVYLNTGTQVAPVQLTQRERNVSFASNLSWAAGTTLKVRVSALVLQNDTIYGPISLVLVK